MASGAAPRRILGLWFPRPTEDRALRGRRGIADEAETLRVLRRWAGRLSPRVTAEAPSGLLIDLADCAYPFGDEPGLLADVGWRCAALSLSVRMAIADTPGAAWAVARYGGVTRAPTRTDGIVPLRTPPGPAPQTRPNRPEGVIVAAGAARAALAALPVAALRLPPDAIAALHRLGLARIGDIADLPRTALTRRFDTGLVRRLDQALGLVAEPIPAVRRGRPAIRATWPQPAADTALDSLIRSLTARLGSAAVTRVQPAESRIPERSALVLAAAWSDAATAPWPAPRSPRPLTLHRPEPIDAAADPMPPARFGWRRADHDLRQAAGPERIAPEWWLDDPDWHSGPRDYWRVETAAGDRLWLFFAHGGAVPGGWFCHGTFA